MTHYDFSVWSAREEMRHIVGRSEPDVIIGSDKDLTSGCKKKDKDHMEFLFELYEAQTAFGRYFVHELTSEVNSTVTKIMAMLGTRTTVADLCILDWLHVTREDQDLSTRVYGRSPTRDKLECGCKVNAQARIDTLVLMRTTRSRKENKQEHGYAKLPEQ